MKWKHKTVRELSGGSLSGNLVIVARAVNNNAEVLKEAIQKIEELSKEIQQYRALGTVEELRIAKEKQIPKKPIEKVMPYSEEVGFNSEWHCPCCESYIGYFAEGMSEPEQMEYCNNCGQHIAKDWSDTD